MSKLKIGDKAIFIKSNAGNEGKIVVVIGFMPEDSIFDGRKWVSDCDLIVESLGSPFYSCGVEFSDSRNVYGMTIPAVSSWLRKLPELNQKQEIMGMSNA